MAKIVSTLAVASTEEATDPIEQVNFKFMKAIKLNSKKILEGRILCIDPGSTSPGYAIYDKAALIDHGVIQPEGKHLHHRLKEIGEAVVTLSIGVDLLVIEKIGPANSKTIPAAYDPLMQSIGAIHAACPVKYMLEVKPITWQLFIDDSYVKADDADAVAIGNCVVTLAESLAVQGEAK